MRNQPFDAAELTFAPLSKMPYFIDLTGQRFGCLTVLGYKGPHGKHSYWYCRCDCGAITSPASNSLRTGHTQSCGCQVAKAGPESSRYVHGGTGTPEYYTWRNMITRCYWVNAECFRNYGGRGITVCERWRTSFANFKADMGERPTPQHTLERIDNDGHYCPENCKWATKSEQALNRRPKYTSRLLTIGNITRTIGEWARLYGLNAGTLRGRIDRGWNLEAALTKRPRYREAVA